MPSEAPERSFYDERYHRLLDSDLRLPAFDGRVNNTLKDVLDFSYHLLGRLDGKRILDFAGGDGWNGVILAHRGAEAVVFDLSPIAGRVALRRAEVNGVGERLSAIASEGTCLPFRTRSVDLVHGCGVLHHIEDLDAAAREIHRVLRPGGRAVFIEPLGHNPVLELARNRVGYRGKCRSPGEKPLRYDDLEPLRRVFPGLRAHERKLLGMLDRVTDLQPLTSLLDILDACLLTLVPPLRRWCRLIVVECPV